MSGLKLPHIAFLLLALACSSAQPPATPVPLKAPNAADVAFMTGMIHHHAQAVTIARWAPTHGASAALQRLAERIVVAQQDEIAIMETWLRDHGQSVHQHEMHMPGMLTAEQMRQLDAARGREFDRLFLTFMIQHHRGALTMVEQLQASHGAAQDETVFRFSSDVFADQSSEIERMEKMLAEMGSR